MNLNVLKYFPVMPDQASDEAVSYDHLFWAINILAIIFTVIVFAIVLYLAAKYRRGSLADRRNPVDHNEKLEYILIGIPTILALCMFVWSTVEFVRYRTMPKDGLEVFVIGKQWMWHLQHMNGVREMNELHIPVDTNVKFTMISQDVIHAFYLPEFRAQYMVVPGRYTELFIHPTKVGKYRMLCAMHCGTDHSEMVGQIYVMSKKDYAEWLANGGNRYQPMPTTMASAGRKVWDLKGCANCHSNVDTMRGPSLTGIYGKTRQLNDGTAIADTSYLRDSILTPWRRITKGYDATMPAYFGQLSEEEVLNLIEYIKSGTDMSSPGKLQPYSPTPPTDKRMGPSGIKTSVDLANENDSAGMTQQEQSGGKQ